MISLGGLVGLGGNVPARAADGWQHLLEHPGFESLGVGELAVRYQPVNVRLGDEAHFLRSTCGFKGCPKRAPLAMIANCLVCVRVTERSSDIIAMEHHFAIVFDRSNLPELGIVE